MVRFKYTCDYKLGNDLPCSDSPSILGQAVSWPNDVLHNLSGAFRQQQVDQFLGTCKKALTQKNCLAYG